MAAKDLNSNLSWFKRMTQVMNYGFGTSSGWFSPQTPIAGQAPQTAGRAFDYRPGFNIDIRPKRESGISFEELRRLADGYDLLKLVIETRKDQIAAFDWAIVATEESTEKKVPEKELEAKIDQARAFFKMPDGRLTWHTWLRKVLDDNFVLDANVFWPVYKGSTLQRLESVDPATIMKFIDESGRTPEPPLPAYRQILHGVPTSDYKKDELMYFMRNPRSNTVYGNSPVEQVLMTVNIGLRREISQLQFFTQGNIPEAIAGVPDTWTPEQIASFQSGWNAMFEGDTGARRQMMFVPNDASKILQLKDSEALLKSEFDEWLIRIICYAFSVSPTPFVKQVNRATAETAQTAAREEGLQPLLDYLKDMFDQIIKQCLKLDGVEFMWNMDEEQDAAQQQVIDVGYVEHGVWSIDDVRDRMGMEKLGVPPMIWTAKGPIPVEKFVSGEAFEMMNPTPPDPMSVDKPGGPPKPGQPKKPGQKPTLGKPNGGKGGGSARSQKFRKAAWYGNPTGKTYRSSRQYITAKRVGHTAEDRSTDQ